MVVLMKIIKKTLVVLILCSFIMGTIPISVLAQQNNPGNQIFEHKELNLPEGVEYAPGEFIVKFKAGTSDETISVINSKNKVVSSEKIIRKNPKAVENEKTKILKKHGLDRIYILKSPKNLDVNKMVSKYNENPDVEYAEQNYKVYIDAVPNDTYFSLLWGLHNTNDADIDAPEAWDIETGNSNEVVIAVIDTGVDYNHEDLAANMWLNEHELNGVVGVDDDGNGYIDDIKGWDFFSDDNDPDDENGHGTHCSGTIAAVGNNSIGVVGVSWNAKIMPLRFLGPEGGYTNDAVSAIYYAIDNGADIMSNSWGGGGYSEALEDAISAANTAGIVFVAAAGNGGADLIGDNNDLIPHYPSSYDVPNVIAVAATDSSDNLAYFSNYGLISVDLSAPGVSIYSTEPGDSYDYKSGTSISAPHVAGAAALIKAQYPELSSDGIKARLLGSVDPIPSLSGITVTGGRLNANNSLVEDAVSPSAVIDLAADNPVLNSIDLTWTATGDDAGSGTASFYDIRYSISEITDANWDTATHVSGETKPQPSGSPETFTVSRLSYSTTYFFAMKVFDNFGNPSELSNVVSETTTTLTIVFQDDMESGINGWNNENLWHKETYRSSSPITSWAYNTGYPNYNYDIGDNKGNLTSPIIDLSDYNSAVLTFQYWYQTEISGTSWDKRYVQIGVDGIFTDIAQLSGDPMLVWNEYSLDISSYAGKSNVQVRFFFDTIDGVFNNYEGWYIDDIAVLGELAGSNNPPVADAGPDQTAKVGVSLTFNGSGSTDSDGTISSYEWDFGDGNTSAGVTTTHAYSTADTYTVTLTVTDDDDATDTDTATVTVTEAPALSMHIASIEMLPTKIKLNGWFTYVTATVTVVDDNGFPIENANVFGTWSGATIGTNSDYTSSNGMVSFSSDKVKNAKKRTEFIFTVNEIKLDGWTYNPSQNFENSGRN
ncbi:MAG: S8 family serine peptidase [Methanosarcinales archaeon]|nr:S8 family serine peptidase [Methanosarcinales archaeon]